MQPSSLDKPPRSQLRIFVSDTKELVGKPTGHSNHLFLSIVEFLVIGNLFHSDLSPARKARARFLERPSSKAPHGTLHCNGKS
jgi:hypothetical protein